MRVAVLGGCGVLGAWVAAEIRQMGASPVVFDHRRDRSILDLADPGTPVVRVDVTSKRQLVQELARAEIDRIVNVAALMPDSCEADPPAAVCVNLLGALNVIEAAHELNVDQVLFFSSRSALTRIGAPHVEPTFQPIPEDHPTAGQSVYGITKMAAEHLCSYRANQLGIGLSCFRLASIYGPGKSARHGSLGIVSHLVEAALEGTSLTIPTGGDQRNDFVYVRDVGRASAMAILHPDNVNGIFHIGSGRLATLSDIATEIKKHMPAARLDVGPGLDYRESGSSSYVLMDITRAREILQFEPKYDIVKGIHDYLRLVRTTGRS